MTAFLGGLGVIREAKWLEAAYFMVGTVMAYCVCIVMLVVTRALISYPKTVNYVCFMMLRRRV